MSYNLSLRTLPTCLLVIAFVAGCSGPLWQLPGGALPGEEQPLSMASIPAQGGVIQLETNPPDPYSVNIGFVVKNGSMYIDPAESRKWYQYIKTNPNVRVRFDGQDTVFTAVAVAETDPAVISQFEPDRHVLRIEARP